MENALLCASSYVTGTKAEPREHKLWNYELALSLILQEWPDPPPSRVRVEED